MAGFEGGGAMDEKYVLFMILLTRYWYVENRYIKKLAPCSSLRDFLVPKVWRAFLCVSELVVAVVNRRRE